VPTFTDGTVVNAAALRSLAGAQPPTYRAHQQSGAQTFTTATMTDVNLDTADTDSDSGRTSTTVYTCKTAGLWLITGWVNWTGNTTGVREVQIAVNGTAQRDSQMPTSSVTGFHASTVTLITPLAVNDTVKLQASQTSGGSLASINPAGGYAGLHMVRISN
jgi:hypothetical protein